MEITILTPSEALDAFKSIILNGSVAGKRSRQPRMQTADVREMDMIGPQGWIAMSEAVDQGAIELASCVGEIHHPEPHERSKPRLPENERVAWTECVELKVAAIQARARIDGESGLVWLIQERVGEGFARGALFGQTPRGELYGMRDMAAAISFAPDIMREISAEGWAARMTALRESKEIDDSIGAGASAPAPRM